MTAPATLLTQAQADGLTLRLDPPDRLKLAGDPSAVAKWAPLLRPHKPELVRLLTDHRAAVTEATTERAVMGLPDLIPQPLSPQFPQYPQIPVVGSSGDIGNIGDRESAVEGEEAIREAQAADGGLAGQFFAHHWAWSDCRAGTQVGAGLHRPCPEGARLWAAYCAAAGREVRP
jgi:hypothetical protein